MSGRFLKFWLPVVLWLLVIFGASTGAGSPNNTSRLIGPILYLLRVPEEYHPPIHFTVRKTAHFVEYAVLGWLFWRALRAGDAASGRQLLLALGFCAFYAMSDEFHQSFVKNREASMRDVFLDSCGAAFGLALYWRCRLRRKG